MTTTKTTASTSRKSSLETARHNEDRILFLLHRFGYMTSPQVGAVIYRSCKESDRLARRTLKRLVVQGYVLCNEGGFGDHHHYALSQSGARRVWNAWGIKAISGKDLIRTPSDHRDAANWAALKLHYESLSIYTEREIQTGQARFKRMANKVPDALGYDAEGYTTWVEVEACRRGGRDMASLADWLVHHAFLNSEYLVPLDSPQDTLWLNRVRFVLAAPSAMTFPSRLQNALAQRLQDRNVHDWAANQLEFQMGTALDAPVQNGYFLI